LDCPLVCITSGRVIAARDCEVREQVLRRKSWDCRQTKVAYQHSPTRVEGRSTIWHSRGNDIVEHVESSFPYRESRFNVRVKICIVI
jgi:hypothetical protein